MNVRLSVLEMLFFRKLLPKDEAVPCQEINDPLCRRADCSLKKEYVEKIFYVLLLVLIEQYRRQLGDSTSRKAE